MTAGLANFGPVSVSDLAKYLRQHLAMEETQFNPKDYDIEQVANLANDFFFEAYSKFISPPPAHPHSFEFWVGGYGSQNVLGEIWKIAFIDGQKEEVAQIVEGNDDHRLLWGGNLAAISRLIFGIDPDIHSKLIDFGVSGDDLRNIVQPAETPLVHSSMPVQDAINLADFLVHVSKKYSAFMPGANIVGGSTDIATVTRHEGFKWIKRKHYIPRASESERHRSCLAKTPRYHKALRRCFDRNFRTKPRNMDLQLQVVGNEALARRTQKRHHVYGRQRPKMVLRRRNHDHRHKASCVARGRNRPPRLSAVAGRIKRGHAG